MDDPQTAAIRAMFEGFLQQYRPGSSAVTQAPTAFAVPEQAVAGPSSASAISAPAPPRIAPYISTRIVSEQLANGHPPPPPLDAAAYPILGQAQLSVPMHSNTAQPRLASTSFLTSAQISDANSRRTAAMQAHALPSTQLPLRPAHASTRATSSRLSSSSSAAPASRRRRGPAQPTPTLADARRDDPNNVLSIFSTDVNGNEMVNFVVLVHPATDAVLTHVPRHQKGSFLRELDKLNLRFPFTLPSNTPITSVQERVAAEMEAGHTAWRFGRPSADLAASMVPSELLDLQLLRLKSRRGLVNATTGAFDLQKAPNNESLTLGMMAGSKQYALSEVTVSGKALDIHFIIARDSASCITSVDHGIARRHECVTDTFNTQFSLDHECGRNQSLWIHPGCTCESGSDSEEQVANSLLIEPDNQPHINSRPAQSHDAPMTRHHASEVRHAAFRNTPTPQASPEPEPVNQHVSEARHVTFHNAPTPLASPEPEPIDVDADTDVDLPDVSLPNPPMPSSLRPGRYAAVFEAADLFTAICRRAMRNATGIGAFNIEGNNLVDAASKMVTAVSRCAQANDFTPCLSTNQDFAIRREDGTGWSSGYGPCKEINLAALRWFTDKSEWVISKTAGRYSVALTSKELDDGLFSSHRLLAAKTFGAIVGLSMARGVAPEMLEPALLQLAANNGDAASLSPEFLREFYPELAVMVEEMNNLGYEGNLSSSAAIVAHLATHYDIQPSALRHRSPALHDRFASEMVLVATVGLKGASHPEIREFVAGFNLQCRNGLTLGEIMRSHPNGTSAYICHSLTTVIHDIDSLLPILRIRVPAPTTLVRFNGLIPTDLNTLLLSFLRGTGVPSLLALQAAQRRLSPLVRTQLDKVDDPSFRPRMLCWAATGHPQMMLGENESIEARWVNQGDPYHPDLAVTSEAVSELMNAGKLTFRCCLNEMKIPVLHLDALVAQTYPIGDITSVAQAIESWLFMEILEAIGGNSLL
ncbi:hypothetical protein C8F01DRAFT_1126272 [Mycena amicta]|nr:hypothetical protein C8F01DRAFT_1126272 [Mycena amicta]